MTELLVPPGIPMSLTVKGNTITWLPSNTANGNVGTTTYYIVQYAQETYEWLLDGNVITTIQPMVELARYLVAGSGRYRVRVRAGNGGGLSDWSEPVIYTPMDQPSSAAGVYVCMYVCMHLCMYVCMYACMYVCIHACMHVCTYVCTV